MKRLLISLSLLLVLLTGCLPLDGQNPLPTPTAIPEMTPRDGIIDADLYDDLFDDAPLLSPPGQNAFPTRPITPTITPTITITPTTIP